MINCFVNLQNGGVVALASGLFLLDCNRAHTAFDMLVGLDDATTDNGCLHYIPGSHKWDLIEPTILAGDMDALKNKLTESQIEEFENQVAIEIKKRLWYISSSANGSYENKSDIPKRASVINVFVDGTKSKYNDGMWEGILMPPNGQKMDGQFYPLLFDSKNIQHEN